MTSLAPSTTRSAGAVEKSSRPAPSEIAASNRTPAGLGRILVVDDDVAFLEMTAWLLQSEGYQCAAARNAADAAHLLGAQEYDLLLTDLEMPGNQDLQLVRSVPALNAGLPVILMTAFPTMESAIQSVQLHIVAYLVKPFDKPMLLNQVRPAIEHFQALRVVRAGHRRVAEWSQALERLERGLELSQTQASGAWPTLLDLTLRNAAEALADARVFAELVTQGQQAEVSPESLNATRPQLLLNALLETITVLDKTRTAFKSKDLAELRKRLEPLLHPRPSGPAGESKKI